MGPVLAHIPCCCCCCVFFVSLVSGFSWLPFKTYCMIIVFYKLVIICWGLPHILKTESSFGRLMLSHMSCNCKYFLRITTQFASLLFYCAALVVANLTKLSDFVRITTFCKPSLHWCAFCSYQVHDHVVAFLQITTYFASLLVYCIAMVVVTLTDLQLLP